MIRCISRVRPSTFFFESAADAYAGRLLAILLSGANHDGAQGIAAVQAAGARPSCKIPKALP